ncbi:hypothetical protein Y032_0815g2496 [Ancylostoma ceylanicum]|uniref:Uncharacterized protein n=1 Tax=Ancylostoma ceylanicum TaxID=53326 RepID=A0A016WC74_9BILA|nr:hypothetical protein Y032_0815g2496 [Ancylostoma ceylanicum]
MRRFSYPNLRYALQNGSVQWAGIPSCYQCNPRFLIKDVSAILGGPSIVVRGRLDPADSNETRNARRWPMRVRCRSHFPSCMASMDVAGAVAQIRGDYCIDIVHVVSTHNSERAAQINISTNALPSAPFLAFLVHECSCIDLSILLIFRYFCPKVGIEMPIEIINALNINMTTESCRKLRGS